jgi:NTE family protein
MDKGIIGEPGSILSLLLSHQQLQPFLAALDRATLNNIERNLESYGVEKNFEWYGVPAGTILFKQGDVAFDIFIVTAGRLGILVDVGFGAQLVAQIRPGEVVGELAMISNEPRSATVVALRNTDVIRVSISAAERLMSSSPQLMLYMLRLLANRLKSTTHGSLQQATKAITVIPIDSRPLDREFADSLYRGFASLSPRVGSIDNSNSCLTTESLEALEEEHDLVIYFADERCSTWSRRCFGQADRAIFVADAASVPDEETDREISAFRGLHRPADLVLLARSDANRPHGASAWLARFAPHDIFHVRRGSFADCARVARLTSGRAVGVVFSGGGARGFAHIGAIRALYAAGIPLDLVGGTSMGGLVAGSAALGGDADAICEMFHHAFVQNNPLNDYTLPLVALLRGRNMSRLLRHHFGDATIENLWKVFFCVSANLSTGKIQVHWHGPLWRAMRASVAIPGVVPPAIEAGEVLVDGGIMNNFPTDVMRLLARGRVIGIEVGSEMPLLSKASDIDEKSLFWRLRNRNTAIPGIIDILMRSGTVGCEPQRAASLSAVDLFIQPNLDSIGFHSFDRFHVAIERGYRATMEAIERLERTPEGARML